MKKFFAMLLVVGSLFFVSTAQAEVKTYTGTDDYTVGERETQEDAQNNSKLRALRNAQEQAGLYIRSRSRSKDLELVEDEIVTLTEGIVKIVGAPQYRKEILSDGKSVLIHTTVTVQIDTEDVDRRLEEIARKHKPAPTTPIDRPKPIETPAPVEQPAPLPEPPVEKIEPTQPVETITSLTDDKIKLSTQKSDAALKLLRAGKAKEALPLCDEAIQLNPNNVDAWNDRGWAYNDLKDYEKALENYNKVIELNPKYKWAYNNRGVVYREQKKYKQALIELNKAIELDPNFAHAYANRGWTYYDMNKTDKALADYNKAIELDPNVAWYWNNRGVVYHNLKGYTWNAIKNYDKAIELDPNVGLYYRNRGRCYRKLDKLEKAKADLKKAKDLGYPD